MKKGNLSIRQLIEKFFKSGKKSIWKSKLFISTFSGLTVITTAGITTTCILLQPQPQQIVQLPIYEPKRPQLNDSFNDLKIYAIDNHYFKTKQSAINYMYQKADLTSFQYNTDHYNFDGHIFPTKSMLNSYLQEKFPIQKVKTMRNPGNHTINSTGEISKNVLTTDYEKPIQIYKGNDGSAYLSKEEALSTYENYHQVYNIEGIERFNEYEARELIENSIKKQLEDSESNKTTCYIQGAICETKAEIKQWLRESVKNGFEYQGQYFSDYNYSDFKNVMNNIDDYIVDKYVKEVVNPDKNSYWISHDANPLDNGYFIGPKYVETSQKLIGNPKFEEVKSFTPSLLLLGAALRPFTEMTEQLLENEEEFEWKNYDIIEYFRNKFKKYELIPDSLDLIKKLFDYDNEKEDSKFYQILQDSTIGLSDITDPSMTDFDKSLVAIKRIMLYLNVYASTDSEAGNEEKSFNRPLAIPTWLFKTTPVIYI